ncbi:MAG: M10 family metallopeptidase domain-containing protein [Actinomycetota bacterium]|nr:M10 family metallopeptidase domain-containing protein [Actinomycetota bacterium]
MDRMRPFAAVAALLALLVSGGSAFAASSTHVLVFKTVEIVGEDGTLVAPAKPASGEPGSLDECRDPSYTFAGPRWKKFEPYSVNVESAPSGLARGELLSDIITAHEAWEMPFTTACPRPRGHSTYEATFAGVTTLRASLVVDGTADGTNVVAFQSLKGTACDGAAACVVIDYEDGRIREADMALEKNLARYGGQYFWTTDDTTWFDDSRGRLAVIDVATHEFGHFAGLGHTDGSPALTMFPYVGDGAQTLGLGDMLGILELY